MIKIFIQRRGNSGSLLKRAIRRQRGLCYYCACPLERPNSPIRDYYFRRATLDHMTPQILGGKNSEKNTVAACHRCNQAKGALHWHEFRAVMKDQHATKAAREARNAEIAEAFATQFPGRPGRAFP